MKDTCLFYDKLDAFCMKVLIPKQLLKGTVWTSQVTRSGNANAFPPPASLFLY